MPRIGKFAEDILLDRTLEFIKKRLEEIGLAAYPLNFKRVMPHENAYYFTVPPSDTSADFAHMPLALMTEDGMLRFFINGLEPVNIKEYYSPDAVKQRREQELGRPRVFGHKGLA
ncbi:MAG: hypothetical protein A3H69_00890 [Candidatus Sungbacteria bacterium RIFCSPLOWO2_02_FULL_47_9]|uniref:Uncharacterized protein n=1 Tax=Candidatus Sungbacteria bacterium RIFCSPHIGHO2_01_FULL_47_32 TaxID=1802264 RepID=A0A1G2K8J6_9BACT|nr:MAG: hypothetical protein UX72_C0004G0028 [Parcubacteria group bacterium GW2011_GWA2_47_10]OGZ95747.1 MAG: hypothetical protein A2633_00420 [Candidatus Sungbacteria bacterium RIFCSPHIGHO2_01_FULL_47_32]OGZ99063.1 MAG: hypothetical protein A3D57_03345 [Candidatus Sungbacteria bacterium RIFCSPHIGHO2_02_FULL_46_12]OHA04554.1 MAG: hypothetical protein A3A28_01165 [Candidatus Sungbacteria bacterium RIFCSPLOWO2_01_FULL_47_32]OHA09598.1 MAG: hypothetical protein A3H69_00890 [Candidatus Sungbacteria